MNEKVIAKNFQRLCISIGFIHRRVQIMSENILTVDQKVIVAGQKNELDSISDDVYYHVANYKS